MKFDKWSNWIDLRKAYKIEITKHDIFHMLFDGELSDAQFKELILKVFEQE